MLVDCYAREDVFAQVPELAEEIDPVLNKLDGLLDDDQLYEQVRDDFGKRYRYTRVAWASLHACRSAVADAHPQTPLPVE